MLLRNRDINCQVQQFLDSSDRVHLVRVVRGTKLWVKQLTVHHEEQGDEFFTKLARVENLTLVWKYAGGPFPYKSCDFGKLLRTKKLTLKSRSETNLVYSDCGLPPTMTHLVLYMSVHTLHFCNITPKIHSQIQFLEVHSEVKIDSHFRCLNLLPALKHVRFARIQWLPGTSSCVYFVHRLKQHNVRLDVKTLNPRTWYTFHWNGRNSVGKWKSLLRCLDEEN
jgi:hypothetical protein